VNLASSDPQTEGRGLQPLDMSTIPEDNDENEYSEISTDVAEAAAAVKNGHDERDSESTGSDKKIFNALKIHFTATATV